MTADVTYMRSTLRTIIRVSVLLALAVTLWSWWSGGIVSDLLTSELSTESRLHRLRQFFQDCGVLAPVVYTGFVTIEVVIAPIPGLMLYAPGGILFGPLLGGSLALIGNVIGAGIACSLTRSLGSTWLTRFFPPDRLDAMQAVIDKRGGWFIFLLRLNPLTSSDLVSYAAGFTRMRIWKVMVATGFGMAPLCYAQAWLAEGLMTSFPWLLYPLLAACAVYAVAVVLVMRRILVRAA